MVLLRIPKKKVLPIGHATEPHSAAQLCSLSSTSFCSSLFNCDHHFSALLKPSQLFSHFATLFVSSQSCSISPPSVQIFSPLPCSSQISLRTLTSAHLVFTLLNSSQLASALLQRFPVLLTSASTQLSSPRSQPSSIFLTYSTLASSSQLFSPPAAKISTRKASCYTEKLYRCV